MMQSAVLLVPAALLAWLGWTRRWVAEDAFIDLRVVQNVLAGHGPVFNAGERIEAYTSPLWVAWLTGVTALAGRFRDVSPASGVLEWLASGSGLVCAAAGVALATAAAARAARACGATGLALPAGALAIAAIPAYWDFATSGLESGLVLAWLGGAYWAVVRVLDTPPQAPRLWPAAVLLGLGPLVRPDLGIISAVFLLLVSLTAVRRPVRCHGPLRIGAAAGVLAAAAVLPVAYQLCRRGYFAATVPNTALAKEAAAARWGQGWLYLADFWGTYWLWLPLLPLGVWWIGLLVRALVRRRRWQSAVLLAAPVVAGALHGAYVIRLGGDFMHGRMLLPSLFAVLLPVAAVAGRRWWHAAVAAIPVAAWAVACALWLHPLYQAIENGVGPQGIADERHFYVWLSRQPYPVTLADYAAASWKRDGDSLHATAAQRRALLLGPDRPPEEQAGAARERPLAAWVPAAVAADRNNIGLLGYAAGPTVHVVDRLGLADPIGSRLALDHRGRPGHEKKLPEAWVVARFSTDTPADSTGAEVTAARDALGCGGLATLLAAVTEPLTAERFVRNLALAWRLTVLRIPADAAAARATLCAQ